MGALKPIAAMLLALAAAAPASAQVAQWRPLVEEASARFGVPADWIERVMTIESRGRTRMAGRPIVSSAGAMGLMQLMPGTWRSMRARLGLGSDPHEPRDNILAGTLYLRLMHDRFGYPGLFAAYNAGPRRYAEHLEGRRALPLETRRYVLAAAGRTVGAAPTVPVAPTRTAVFFALAAVPVTVQVADTASDRSSPALPTGLFAVDRRQKAER